MYNDEELGGGRLNLPCGLDVRKRRTTADPGTGSSILLWHCSLHQEKTKQKGFLISTGRKRLLHECVT